MKRVRIFCGNMRALIPYDCAEKIIKDYKAAAETLSKTSSADHIVYAIKDYNLNGTLDHIKCYEHPLEFNDEEFKKRANCSTLQVYAIHRR